MYFLTNNYVDSVDTHALTEDGFRAILKKLDPHSIYLTREELKEMEVAILENDLVGVADALCDLQYVLSGAILEFGLGDKFKALFEEVQRSNMSKACNSEEEAMQTIEYYKQKDGTECHFKKEGNKWLVYRTSDNKTIKSINYSPANLDGILSNA